MKKGIIFSAIMSFMLVVGAICLPAGECRANDFMNCWSESYFENHPMTVQQMTEQYGKPSKIVDLESGIQDCVYHKFSKEPMLESTRLIIVKDEKVLKSYLKD